MRIGISGGAATIDRLLDQAVRAEEDGFAALWYAGASAHDPLAALPLIAKATSRIELGTSVVQTYPVHPVQMARLASVIAEIAGPDRFVLGLGPSHKPSIEGSYGIPYDHPARHTRAYIEILTALLRGEAVKSEGPDFTLSAQARQGGAPVAMQVMISALAPRMLRTAGELTAGTITWMANRQAIESHVAPLLAKAAANAGRDPSTLRVVCGLPIAVCDDAAEAREAAARQFAGYGFLPNYQRILKAGDAEGPAAVAVVGTEDDVAAQLQAHVDAGVTDLWCAIFPVGTDRDGSRRRTRDLLKALANA